MRFRILRAVHVLCDLIEDIGSWANIQPTPIIDVEKLAATCFTVKTRYLPAKSRVEQKINFKIMIL